MQIARGILGAILLFLGYEMNFLLAGGMAALIGFRLTPMLPANWPQWGDIAFMGVLALVAAGVTMIRERWGFFLSGFLAGSYFLVEYYAPGVLTLPLLPFIVGGVLGSLVMGIFTDWALVIVSCLIGAYYITSELLTLSPTAETLLGAGLFVVGALTQVILMRMQKSSER